LFVALVQRIAPYLGKFLGIDASLWCNSLNLPVSGVGSGSRQVLNIFLIRALVLTLEKFAMKKTLIALAAVAATGAAFAQSTVTLSGTFGAAYQSYESAAAAGKLATAQTGTVAAGNIVPGTLGTAPVAAATNKGLAPVTDASIKATVVEDLGGGLKVTAAGQFAMNASRGGNLTKEDSSITLAGGFGSVALASTRASDTAISANVFASWLPRVSFYDTVSSRAAIDTFNYTSPELIKGLRVGLTHVEGTEGVVTAAAKVNVVSATYSAGPLMVAFAQKATTGLTAAQITAGAKKNNTELAATYDMGVAKVGLGYDSATTTKAAATGAVTGKAMTSYGISVPMGAITMGVNGAKRGDANFYDAGINYDLSKRTSIRAQFGKMEGGSFEGNQSRIGVLHTF
jgi:Gram-negative porin